MYSEQLEQLIRSVIADGVITEKERSVLHKKAAAEGIDEDEIDVYVDGLVAKMRPVEQKPIAPQKQGVVTKCPQCGAVVDAGAVKCAECGYVFRGVEANSSMKELAERLAKAKEEDYAMIIRNFPIPTTKEDLLEFIPAMKTRFKTMTHGYTESGKRVEPIRTAYKAKYKEAVAKAKMYFADDRDFQVKLANEKLYDGVLDYLNSDPFHWVVVIFGIMILCALIMVMLGK